MPRRPVPRAADAGTAGPLLCSGLTDDRLQEVRAEAHADHAAEASWEPSDWSACLRRERRQQLAVVTGLVVLVGIVAPVLRLALVDRPPSLSFIGAADRALVTERARTMARWAKGAFVGWPLLGAVLVAGLLDDHLPSSLVAPVVLLCLLLVGRAARRARLARRWLTGPLPREERTSCT